MREKLKIAIWMNIPSHYQRAFFEVLSTRDCIDLQVRYLEELPAVRKAQGWKEQAFLLCEQCVARISRVEDQLETMPDWRERIHIISCVYSRPLVGAPRGAAGSQIAFQYAAFQLALSHLSAIQKTGIPFGRDFGSRGIWAGENGR